MYKILHFTLLDFKQLLKSKTFYLKLILFPSVLILLLGKALGGSDGTISVFPVAVYNEDEGYTSENAHISLGNTLEADVLKSKDIKTLINVTTAANYEEGVSIVKEGKAAVFIYIPKDFTKSFLTGANESITVIGNNNNPIDKSIVTSILDQFIQTTKTELVEEKEFQKLVLSNDNKGAVDAAKIQKHLADTASSSIQIPEISTNLKTVPTSAMQYISIAMVVMFSISTAFTLVHSVVGEKLNYTLFRIKSTPTLNLLYILGKLSGIIFAVVMQMAIVILITGFIFKMKWGNPFFLLLCTIVYAFAIGSIVLMWGLLAKDQNSVSSLASPILYGFSFLGGSFVSSNALPESLQIVQKIIPNGKAINCYLSICQGRGFGSIYKDLLQLILTGFLFLILALYLYNGKEFIKHDNSHNDKKTVKAAV